ncbi:phage tail tape measure protein [uncultured Clostridium sp.]|uniref:phage tail tape measure protein n=1 Tax=uncultured Clostridium sp. TaxID=59620 RepID=UPI0026206E96|nr:phage tail tape measure protein [uncultured Clostridium sp.]
MLEPLTTSFNIVGSGLSALKQIQDSYNRLKSSFKTTEVESKNSFGKMKTYANSFFNTMQRGVVKVGTGFKTMMARSALSFKNFMGSFLGKALLIGSILGVGIGVGSMINEYRQFDDIMLQTKAIAGATETQYVSLREQAKELGRTTRFEAFQVAEAQKYQAVAGWKVNEILKATPAIMDLAAASGENLGTVSDIVTDSMTAFKWAAKDAAKFTDILAATATSTNTNISMLGESFKYVSPMASALGESVESTATYLGMLANAGIKGSMAGTSLNQVFSSLLNPTDEVNASLYKMGVNLKDSKGNFVGLQSVFKSLRAGLKGMGEFEQAATLNKIFGERGGRAVLTILKSTNEEFDSLFSKIKNSYGSTKKMADIMNSGFGGAMDRLKSSASGLKLEIMEILSKPMAKWFDGSAKKMDDWTKKIKPLTDDTLKFWKENKEAIIGIATVIGYMIAPMATLATWFIGLYNNCDDFREIVDFTFKHLFGFIKYSIEKIQDMIEWVKDLGEKLKDSFSLFKTEQGFKTSLEMEVPKQVDIKANLKTNSLQDSSFAASNLVIEKLTKEKIIEKNTEMMNDNIKGSNITNTSNSSNKTVHNTNTFIIQSNDEQKTKKTIMEVLYEEKIKAGEI